MFLPFRHGSATFSPCEGWEFLPKRGSAVQQPFRPPLRTPCTAVGDIYPEAVQLKKGEYTIRAVLRHDDAGLLEKLKARTVMRGLNSSPPLVCLATCPRQQRRRHCLLLLRCETQLGPQRVVCVTFALQAMPMVVERKLDQAIQAGPASARCAGGGNISSSRLRAHVHLHCFCPLRWPVMPKLAAAGCHRLD